MQEQKYYLRRNRTQKTHVNFPYPNPIKLFSREAQKEIKGDYLNAELMNQGVALQIAEIRPDTNIEKEIFPRELTRDAQEKEIFTPPNHKQMRFEGDSKPSSDNQFFITENIDQMAEHRGVIQEEHSQESEEEDAQDLPDLEGQDDFDFGRAKLDFFKSKAREILLDDLDVEYEGQPHSLGTCYKHLKNSLRNPVVVHHNGSDQKPGYLKMTFSMMRNAVNGDRFLEISKLKENQSKISENSSFMGSKRLPALMRAGKEMQEDNIRPVFFSLPAESPQPPPPFLSCATPLLA